MGSGASTEVGNSDAMYSGHTEYPNRAQNLHGRGSENYCGPQNGAGRGHQSGYVQSSMEAGGRGTGVTTGAAHGPLTAAAGSSGSQQTVQPNQRSHNMNLDQLGSQASQCNRNSSNKGKIDSNTQKTLQTNNEAFAEDDIVLETFHHRNGETYTCMYQARQRFLMNSWANGEWISFPVEWYNEGFLVTDSVIRGDENPDLHQDVVGQLVCSQAFRQNVHRNEERWDSAEANSLNRNDRGGEISLPSKGVIATYMTEERRNVHCYFDQNSGQWVKLPIAWELHSEFVKSLVRQVEEQAPQWRDEYDILAMLRACNYDVNECISTWWTIVEDYGMVQAPHSSLDETLIKAKDSRIRELELRLEDSRVKHEQALHHLAVAKSEQESAHNRVNVLQEQLAELQVTARSATLKTRSLSARLQRSAEVIPKHQGISETGREGNIQAENQMKEFRQQADEIKSTARQLARNTSAVGKAYRRLHMEIEQGFGDFAKLLSTACDAAMQLPLKPPGPTVSYEEMEELRGLYRKECFQRKLLHNQLQELRGNIRVFARCRKDDRVKCIVSFPTAEDISVTDANGKMRTFRFDRCYSPDSTQEEVFEETRPIVTSCVDGYNVCILAYGQTGSGKTFTMMGPKDSPGVNIRAIQELLKITDDRVNVEYKLTVSMVEIYNEIIQDLLTKDCKVVTIQQIGTTVNIPGLSSHPVKTRDDITNLMNIGMTNRTVASTKMNSESSRSHLLIMLTVEGRDFTSNVKSKGTLTLVDLAGSERVSKTDASGQRLVEAAAINKSLTALGQVFTSLGQSALHIPFRNSKLTQVLQPSLSGDAKAALFVACSPDESNVLETISTLQFGSNAKQIELGQAKKNVTKKK